MGDVRQSANDTRYNPGQSAGHYESFFLRANHPARPLAFWIRYTLFSPQGRPQAAVGELWAIYFDGETHQHVAVSQEVPWSQCAFARDTFQVHIGEARLAAGSLRGAVTSGGHSMAWDLTFAGDEPPLCLLPINRYDRGFPKAKSLVALPLARFDGTLSLDHTPLEVWGWMGSQNHNWGSQHTDRYAWGQVAGFDGQPASFLEVASAAYRIGPLWTPFFTPIVLRHGGHEYALNGLSQSLRAHAALRELHWHFDCATANVRLAGRISAPREDFVALRYRNPPGGEKLCLSSKLASCQLTLTHKRSGQVERLMAAQRAAFEILSDPPVPTAAARVN